MTSRTTDNGANIEQYKSIHQNVAGYGAGSRHFEYVQLILRCCQFSDILDFGCGKGVLADQITESGAATCVKYDPARPGIDALPNRRFDAVVNTDVLEHVPESELDDVLNKFVGLSNSAIIIPHLAKARVILPNGENAHCTIKTPEEWLAIFKIHYKYVFRLAHHSPKHALFLCSQDEKSVECLEASVEYLVRQKSQPNEVRAFTDAPFMTRAKTAAALLAGKSGLDFMRSLKRTFRKS